MSGSATTETRGERTPYPVRLWSLASKELRETLRDRRTIITLVLMPLIVYPILSVVFRTFLMSTLGSTADDNLIRYTYLIQTSGWSEEAVGQLFAELEYLAKMEEDAETTGNPGQEGTEEPGKTGYAGPARPAPISGHVYSIVDAIDLEEATRLVESGEFDAAILLASPSGSGTDVDPLSVQLAYSRDVPVSHRAADFVTRHFDRYNRIDLQQRLVNARLNSGVAIQVRNVAVSSERTGGTGLATIIPLVLVLMTITGAVYPAIDLTAGERERGTLETLIATPAPRIKILLGKLIAVLTVAVLTASLNVIGMMSTVWAFQLDKLLLGETPLTMGMVARIFGLLVLFATFFSALLLVVTSFARSFKEAQAYLIPIILLSLGPGLVAMSPGLELSGPLAVCPMVNILLLARDILTGGASLGPAAIAVFSTMVYAAAAIGLAATIFGADSILYGSEGSWQEMLMRPAEGSRVASPATSMFILAMLLPLNFILIALMGRLGENINLQLGFSIGFTILSFFLIPLLFAWHYRIRKSSGFGFLWPGITPILIGLLLGLVLWPAQMSLISNVHTGWEWIAGADSGQAWQERLVDVSKEYQTRFREAPLPLILVALAVVPAVCEEWFFRGMLQRSILGSLRPVYAILISSAAFGVFHTLSENFAAIDRLISTVLMGLVLGWIAWRTNSVIPTMVLHLVHNASVTLLSRYSDALGEFDWFPGEEDPIPGSWVAASVIAVVVLISILALYCRRRPVPTL